jgi:hypothetical protein
MSAITSNSHRAAAHRDYRVLLGLTTPLFVAGVAFRRLGLLPADPLRPASFAAAVRNRAAAVIPFAFMG